MSAARRVPRIRYISSGRRHSMRRSAASGARARLLDHATLQCATSPSPPSRTGGRPRAADVLLSTKAGDTDTSISLPPRRRSVGRARKFRRLPEGRASRGRRQRESAMRPGLRSLNVAVAVAMVLGEACARKPCARPGAPPMAEAAVDPLDARKEHARVWFEELRDRICAAFERLETKRRASSIAARPAAFETEALRAPTIGGPTDLGLPEIGNSSAGSAKADRWRRAAHGDDARPHVRESRRAPSRPSMASSRPSSARDPGAELDPSFWA